MAGENEQDLTKFKADRVEVTLGERSFLVFDCDVHTDGKWVYIQGTCAGQVVKITVGLQNVIVWWPVEDG